MVSIKDGHAKGREMKIPSKTSSDPSVHTRNIRPVFDELINHLREDINKINEPKAGTVRNER
jgi:hypothetical protein